MEKAVAQVDTPVKTTLSVPLLSAYLSRGWSQVRIADALGVSRQAVDQYIDRHYDELRPILDGDSYMAAYNKQIAIKAMRRVEQGIDECDPAKNLLPLNAISGTHQEKSRLWAGQSTDNVSMFTHLVEAACAPEPAPEIQPDVQTPESDDHKI